MVTADDKKLVSGIHSENAKIKLINFPFFFILIEPPIAKEMTIIRNIC